MIKHGGHLLGFLNQIIFTCALAVNAGASRAKLRTVSMWCPSEPVAQEFAAHPHLQCIGDLHAVLTNSAVDSAWVLCSVEQLEYSVASLHARFYSKILIALESFRPGPGQQLHIYKYTQRGYREHQRALRVYCSGASIDKHRKIYDELCQICQRATTNGFRSDCRYTLSVIEGSANALRVCEELEGTESERNIRSLVWIVTKGERNVARAAVAAAVRKPPNAISNVMTMSDFVQSLGTCEKRTDVQ